MQLLRCGLPGQEKIVVHVERAAERWMSMDAGYTFANIVGSSSDDILSKRPILQLIEPMVCSALVRKSLVQVEAVPSVVWLRLVLFGPVSL
jgi:hypothetical protein